MKNTVYFLTGNFINGLGFFSKQKAASLALRLFTTPMKGFIKKDQLEFLGSAFQEEFEYNSLPITTYRWPGNDKTILLAHGWESNSARWEKLIYQLKAKNYNIIALDAPAHGNSGGKRFTAVLYSEFINVVIQRFHPEIIVAHSVGGMATIFAFEKYKFTSVEKLVLIGSPSEFKGILDRYTKLLKINKRVSTQLESLIQKRFNKLPSEFSTANSIRNITIEGLIIHDETDQVIPFQDALEIKKNFKNSKLISTKNMGHSLNNEKVHAQIKEFLSSKSISLQYERSEANQ